jgi:hypothetical protein
VAATSLKLPEFRFGKALAAAQQVFAERTGQPVRDAELAAAR